MLDEGSEIGIVFFDLRKAFDSVPHKVLMDKLQQIGLYINILAWVGNYLTFRKQMVVVNGSSSSDSHVLSRVPQRFILGPLLFLIYIDHLTHLPTSRGSCSVLYMWMTSCCFVPSRDRRIFNFYRMIFQALTSVYNRTTLPLILPNARLVATW